MDKRSILDKILNQPAPIQVWVGWVKSVEGKTCTVLLDSSDLEVEEVSLVADVDAESYFVVVPKLGSRVLVGMVENDIATMYVVQCAQVDSLECVISNVSFKVDEDTVSLKKGAAGVLIEGDNVTISQGKVVCKLADTKVEISNGSISLGALFGDLVTLLNSFSVLTSTGPSAGLNPSTTVLLAQLQTKLNLFLK